MQPMQELPFDVLQKVCCFVVTCSQALLWGVSCCAVFLWFVGFGLLGLY
jgi:hypothetical protein